MCSWLETKTFWVKEMETQEWPGIQWVNGFSMFDDQINSPPKRVPQRPGK